MGWRRESLKIIRKKFFEKLQGKSGENVDKSMEKCYNHSEKIFFIENREKIGFFHGKKRKKMNRKRGI